MHIPWVVRTSPTHELCPSLPRGDRACLDPSTGVTEVRWRLCSDLIYYYSEEWSKNQASIGKVCFISHVAKPNLFGKFPEEWIRFFCVGCLPPHLAARGAIER